MTEMSLVEAVQLAHARDMAEDDTVLVLGEDVGVNGGIQDLYETGNLAFVGNVGTLVEPITDAFDYRNSGKRLPENLFSHNHQQAEWQTVNPDHSTRKATGWGGRLAEQMIAHNANGTNSLPELSMNVSLARREVLLVGNTLIPYTISAKGVTQLRISGGGGPTYANCRHRRRIVGRRQSSGAAGLGRA